MMNVHWIYCGNPLMMHVSQIILSYTWNLYSTVCQLYLNETERKRAIHGFMIVWELVPLNPILFKGQLYIDT